jgi:glycosyltransferase involved in cell wall biosynthesis
VYIPEYLSAGDFFVLPSQEEGSCNAIIEAMACGLPIIASTGAFNDDILDKKYSIRVEANDIGSLEKAMKVMYLDHTITSQMSIAAREASKKFDIDKRAKSILNWMNSMI